MWFFNTEFSTSTINRSIWKNKTTLSIIGEFSLERYIGENNS